MKYFDEKDLNVYLGKPSLIDTLQDVFASDISAPTRMHYSIPEMAAENDKPGTLLLMPAWETDAYLGVKIVTVFPNNKTRNLPSVQGQYYLADGQTGTPLAVMHGATLTAHRTAAVSALASRYLSRADSQSMLMVGCGTLAPQLIRYHAMVRPLSTIWLWGRDYCKASKLAETLLEEGLPITAVKDMDSVIGDADIVSAATLAVSPLIKGELLSPGTHVDLVGAFRPDMREADDTVIARARKFADTREGALKEAGEFLIPIESGQMNKDDVIGDLFQLSSREVVGRSNDEEITLFKSVGTAASDYAAATIAWRESQN